MRMTRDSSIHSPACGTNLTVAKKRKKRDEVVNTLRFFFFFLEGGFIQSVVVGGSSVCERTDSAFHKLCNHQSYTHNR